MSTANPFFQEEPETPAEEAQRWQAAARAWRQGLAQEAAAELGEVCRSSKSTLNIIFLIMVSVGPFQNL